MLRYVDSIHCNYDVTLLYDIICGTLALLPLMLTGEGFVCRFVFRRLDGSMSMANRDQAIVDFQEQAGVNILIVSLKAAALGLNLVAANHVVLMDLVSPILLNHLPLM